MNSQEEILAVALDAQKTMKQCREKVRQIYALDRIAFVVSLRQAGWGLDEIAYVLGSTREYIRSIEKKATGKTLQVCPSCNTLRAVLE